MELSAQSAAPARLTAYLLERFPPAAYGVLVALFFGSAVLTASALGEGALLPRGWLGSFVVLLVFFHLRVFDEHKDRERDLLAHPDRLLSRGVVTLPFLARAGAIAIALEGGLSALVGPRAVLAWLLALGFTVLMRLEFGVGRWLNQHPVAYALSHNPVVALLGLYGWACTDAPFDPRLGAYLLAVSLGSLAFEVGRKMRLPAEERPHVETYTGSLGTTRARTFLAVTVAAGTLVTALAIQLVGGGVGPLALVGIATLSMTALGRPSLPGKKTELGATLYLLLCLLALGWAAW